MSKNEGCDEKRLGVRGKEGDGYRSARKQKERKTEEEAGGLWETIWRGSV